MSAAFAGFAGTLFAARQGFVSPESFTFAESAFCAGDSGARRYGSQFAVILAAILLVVSRELMRDFNEYSMPFNARWFDGADDNMASAACCP
ncbi:hypothetical protein ACVXHB_07185 [Escherichia coli]